jgi:hypothetical protein
LKLAEKLSQDVFQLPSNTQDIALQRYLLGAAEERPGEALLDFTIALAALLLPGIHTEVSYRFALNGARLLAGSADERNRNFAALRKVYTQRSKVVHGELAPHDAQAVEASHDARRLAEQLLLEALEGGWPTTSDFASLALE